MQCEEAFKSAGSDRRVSAEALQDLFLEVTDRRKLTAHQILPIVLYWGGMRQYIGGSILGVNIKHMDDPEIVRRKVDNVRDVVRLLDAVGTPYDFTVQATSREGDFGFEVTGEVGILEDLDDDPKVNFGRNFGYPSCCIAAFGWGNNGQYDRLLTMQSRHNGETAYVLHIPCTGDCEQTLALAGNYRDFTTANFPRLAEYLERNHLASSNV